MSFHARGLLRFQNSSLRFSKKAVRLEAALVPPLHSTASVLVERGTSPASKHHGMTKTGEVELIGRESSINFTSITDFHGDFSFGVSVIEMSNCFRHREEPVNVIGAGKYCARDFPGSRAAFWN